MSSVTLALDHEIAPTIEIVERRTIAFFRDELGMATHGAERRLHRGGFVTLRAMTAIVAVGSTSGLYIAFSYDDPLIRAVMWRFASGLTIEPDQERLYAKETASEVVNVIVGNATAELVKRGELTTLSPPVLMAGARTIEGRPDSSIGVLTLRFADGNLDVAFVGPRILFDDHLNYRGDES